MGLIFKSNQDLLKNFAEADVPWKKAIIEPGQQMVKVKAAELTMDEVETVLLKLDQMAMSRQHEGIAAMLAEEADSILLAVRMVKTETKQPFLGMQALGANLDMTWLKPRHVGDNTLLNSANTAALGLYLGTNAGVFTWDNNNLVADTWASLIPSQTMIEEAAVVHLGAIDPSAVPKINTIEFTLAGIVLPTQVLDFNIRPSLGDLSLPFVRFEKPIIVGPEKRQLIRVKPNITGGSKFQLVSLLITKGELLIA